MNKEQVIKFLEKAGILVKNNQIAKADVAKAKQALSKIDELDSRIYGKLNSIINLVNSIDFPNKGEVLDFLHNAKNEIYERSVGEFEEQTKLKKVESGYVSIDVKPGDKVKCINDKKYIRQYGSGSDWTVPVGIKEGEVYTVVKIAEDYFGANKLVLDVNGKNTVVNPLYMNGQDYGQRFEKVGKEDKEISRVI